MKKIVLGALVGLFVAAQSFIPAAAAPPVKVFEVEATLETADDSGCVVMQVFVRGTLGIFETGLVKVQLIDRCTIPDDIVFLASGRGTLEGDIGLTIDKQLDKAFWTASTTLIEPLREGPFLGPLVVSFDLTFCGCGKKEHTTIGDGLIGLGEPRAMSRQAVVTGPVSVGDLSFEAHSPGTIRTFKLKGGF